MVLGKNVKFRLFNARPSRSAPILISIFTVSIVLLSCSIFLGGPTPPGSAIPSDSDSLSVASQWQKAFQEAPNGNVVVIFSESQLTAYLQSKLEDNPNNNFQDVQVFLRDGRIKIYGMVHSGQLSASTLISMLPTLQSDGELVLTIEDAQVGPIDLPKDLLSSLSASISKAITGDVGAFASGFSLKEILIGDGKIAMRGTIRH